MSEKIQFRRGTDAERSGVILDQGEPAWATDTRKFFIGDGVTLGGIIISSGNSSSSSSSSSSTNYFAKEGNIYNSDGIPSQVYIIPLWRAQFSCTVTGVHGLVYGSGATVNAIKNNSSDLLISNISSAVGNSGVWISSGIIQNSGFSAGDTLSFAVRSTTGFPQSISVQVDFRQP